MQSQQCIISVLGIGEKTRTPCPADRNCELGPGSTTRFHVEGTRNVSLL